jgi:hypothetical protein
MLEIAALAAPVLSFLILFLLARAGGRALARAFSDGLAASGWVEVRTEGRAELRLSRTVAGRELALETFVEAVGDARETYLGGRVVGLAEVPDVWLVTAETFKLTEVPSGLVEVPVEAWFSQYYRVFAGDVAAFDRWCDATVRRALVHTGCVQRLEVRQGTLTLRVPHARKLELLDAVTGLMVALIDPASRADLARWQGPRPQTRSGAVGCVALVLTLLAVPLGCAFAPVTDFAPGRVVAAPIVCPQGGVPRTLHHDAGWNVRCMAEGRDRDPHDRYGEGDFPSSRLPTLTTLALTLEVYGGLCVLLVLGYVHRASRRSEP